MAVPNPITQSRLFRGVFICMRCNCKTRSDPIRVKRGLVSCRKCGYKGLRAKKKAVKAKA
ncbi:MAG: 50S ribosomal protein L40e [archaeon]